MNGDGGVYIKQLLDNGALVEDFTIELLGIYPLKECLDREAELAKTSLFPKGLNGNAGSYVVMTEEVREKISKAVREKVVNGTHHFLDSEFQSKNARKNNLKRVEEGTHPFLGGEISRKTQKKRIEDGTHHFLGSETNLKRIEDGTHHLLGGSRVTALNIETGEVHNIPSELYHSRRDIYFAISSKVFKEWKQQQEVIVCLRIFFINFKMFKWFSFKLVNMVLGKDGFYTVFSI